MKDENKWMADRQAGNIVKRSMLTKHVGAREMSTNTNTYMLRVLIV